MLSVTEQDIQERMRLDNPWWDAGRIDATMNGWPRRAYFAPFLALTQTTPMRRALVLMGPRRVGKTVMLHHAVQALIDQGVRPRQILYVSLDTPLYSKLPLERLLKIYLQAFADQSGKRLYVIYDEIQYLKDWAVHLKSLVDTVAYRHIQFIASGSAAAALNMASHESGAGRFADFRLPPLTFAEYLTFTGQRNMSWLGMWQSIGKEELRRKIIRLNEDFIRYLNIGGYPEIVMAQLEDLQSRQYLQKDIIDKVLLGDLPSLYGISDIQELKDLFTVLAYNTGQEVSLDELSKRANISKTTIRRYLDYLEAAFLIRRVERIDHNARAFQRARSFKVYLTNPCLRCALFGAVDSDHEIMGAMAETAIFSQWFHVVSPLDIHYARWADGEIDLVHLKPGEQKPDWLMEIKWSDRYFDRPSELRGLLTFADRHADSLRSITVTTRTKIGPRIIGGHEIEFVPTAMRCHEIGKNITESIWDEVGLEPRLPLE
jgi:predicted AAA+ superfamily ATPase